MAGPPGRRARWQGGGHDEAALLRSAYTASLDLVAQASDGSVAFSALSCGIYGYPLDEAAEVSLSAVRAWLSTHRASGIEDILWVLRGSDVMAAFRGAPSAPRPGW